MNISAANNLEYLASAMNMRHLKQSNVISGSSDPVDFKQLLSKVDLEGVRDGISKKYGLSVGSLLCQSRYSERHLRVI